MTLATTSNTVVCQGNGVTTSFDFTFPVPLASELFVYLTAANGTISLIPPSQYTVTGIGTGNGGSVTYPLTGSPIATGTSLTIQRIVTYQQLTSLVNQSGYYPNVVENALDYLTMQTQQLAEAIALALQVPFSATPANLTFPSAAARAGQLAGFDANGNAITYPVTASVGAGNMTAELGSNGHPGFKAGTDFTAGTTTSLTLSQAYGSVANVLVCFDGVYQEKDSYSINGTQLLFTTPIPVGVQNVDVVGGTTISANVPASGSVTDSSVAAGSKLYNRINDWVDVKDPAFGAKGNGIADDTAALQAALNSLQTTGGIVFLPPGTYNISSTPNVPVGVSLLGCGTAPDFEGSGQLFVTRLKWIGANGGVLLNHAPLYQGFVKHLILDGNNLAANIWQLGNCQNSVFEDVLVLNQSPTANGSGMSMFVNAGSTPNFASSCTFTNVNCLGMQWCAFATNGMTSITFVNCNWQTFAGFTKGRACVELQENVDTNQWFGGGIGLDAGATGGTCIIFNGLSPNNDVYGNNFYGTYFSVSDPTGTAVDVRNSASHQNLYGCFLPSEGTQITTVNGSAPGKIKLWGSSGWPDGNQFRAPFSLTPGASPWTWTNDGSDIGSSNPGNQVDFRVSGGTVTSVSLIRNGVSTTLVDFGSAPGFSLLLEPNDGISISYSSVPTVQVVPH